ncbi:hypothetical protein SAY87_012520 [Trapa incisa]|uniref:Dienelactone hydrolase domain-containing protein n=1 Tax=Trapa incisa TaxID=236973 RepID=A0AAN7GSS7_9MYRT|nr:hypothetical protein SAY87_012520 [Trapa incisa]
MSGPQCCENPPTLNPNCGSGHLERIAGLNAYVTGLPESKFTVVLVSDIFGITPPSLRSPLVSFLVFFHYFGGFEAPNLRNLADKVAASGFYVVVPDYFKGDPYNPENAERPIAIWLKDHGHDKGFEETKLIVEALKGKGLSPIGAAGFCWGAKVVVELSKLGVIEAAVMLHPSFVTVEDIKAVTVPICVLGAEIDQMSPPVLLKKFEEALATKPEVDAFVKIFPKVSHGWTVRYDVGNAEAVKCAEEAHLDMTEWFVKYLK